MRRSMRIETEMKGTAVGAAYFAAAIASANVIYQQSQSRDTIGF
jgi:hypothetical protein